jgi:hypothetical protein
MAESLINWNKSVDTLIIICSNAKFKAWNLYVSLASLQRNFQFIHKPQVDSGNFK